MVVPAGLAVRAAADLAAGAQIPGEHGVHDRRMLAEPVGHRGRQHPADLEVAARHPAAHIAHDQQHVLVLVGGAVQGRKTRSGHAPVLVAEVRLGVFEKRIQARKEFRIRRRAHRVEQVDELAMRRIHGFLAEFQLGGPVKRARHTLRHTAARAFGSLAVVRNLSCIRSPLP